MFYVGQRDGRVQLVDVRSGARSIVCMTKMPTSVSSLRPLSDQWRVIAASMDGKVEFRRI